jgi:stage V sporulation protein R
MSSNNDRNRRQKQKEAATLSEPVRMAGLLAKKLGLDPYPVNYWVVDYAEMNELIAYDGFQRRYPHWRWGMKWDRQRKQDRFGLGRAFEIVNNDDPSNAFLQQSNTLADQKAVITHVEAHSDFFKNNEWYRRYTGDSGPAAAAMLEHNGERIASIIEDLEVDRSEVERFIDAVLCLEDCIDQHGTLDDPEVVERHPADIRERLEELGLSEDVREQVFDEAWLDAHSDTGDGFDAPRRDVLAYLRDHGQTYDADENRAVDREPWQAEIIDLLRREAYYFAPQRMTKVMNEGWAAYWESLMMADEGFAGDDEVLTYADHMSKVLASPGLNPYKLGKELWEYVENTANRRALADLLLRVEGITPKTFHDTVDFSAVAELLEPDSLVTTISSADLDALDPDDPRIDAEALEQARAGELDVEQYPWLLLTYEGLAERHYSLAKPQYRGFLKRIPRKELAEVHRYMFDDTKYGSIEEALLDLDYTMGWERMREVRASHNDVTFIDSFLTQEFVDSHGYFAFEYSRAKGDYRATSLDVDDVKKKLLLQFTNFGKPTIAVYDGNFDNRGELLLGHRYNGVALDVPQAKQVLERVFDLWGRPVNLATIVKEYDESDVAAARRRNEEPEPRELGKRFRFDGDGFSEHRLDDRLEAEISADAVDYDTKPDDWLA